MKRVWIVLFMIFLFSEHQVYAMQNVSEQELPQEYVNYFTRLYNQEYSAIRELYPFFNKVGSALHFDQLQYSILFRFKKYTDATLDVPCLYLWVRFLKERIARQRGLAYGLLNDDCSLVQDCVYYMTLCILILAQDTYICRKELSIRYRQATTYRNFKSLGLSTSTYEIYDAVRSKFLTWSQKWMYNSGTQYHLQRALKVFRNRKEQSNTVYLLSAVWERPNTIRFNNVPVVDYQPSNRILVDSQRMILKKFEYWDPYIEKLLQEPLNNLIDPQAEAVDSPSNVIYDSAADQLEDS